MDSYYISFRIDDIDSLMEAVEATASITDVIIEDNRRRHVTLLLSERHSALKLEKTCNFKSAKKHY